MTILTPITRIAQCPHSSDNTRAAERPHWARTDHRTRNGQGCLRTSFDRCRSAGQRPASVRVRLRELGSGGRGLARFESESAAGAAVTGSGPRERLAALVAEIRDVTFIRSRSPRPGPGEPLFRNHRQDHRRAGSRAPALGPALGCLGHRGGGRPAQKRRHRPALFGDQRADPLGCSD